MENLSISALPDTARVWIYVADRPLSDSEQELVLSRLSGFTNGWLSHGRQVHGATTIRYGRVLILAGDIPGGDLSGCGIDASVRQVEDLAREIGFAWLSGLTVMYFDEGGQIQAANRSAFRALAETGAVDANTRILDTTVDTLRALRHGDLEQPAGMSWHGRTFNLRQPA